MTSIRVLLVLFFSALALSLIFTPLMRALARRFNILAPVDKRRVHKQPTPYLGGLAIYLSFVMAMALLFLFNPSLDAELSRQITGVIIAGMLIVALGLWDDMREMKPLLKLTGQLVAACVLFYFGLRIELFRDFASNKEVALSVWLSAAVTIVWILGVVNAINLIDGLDGLAAGITVIVSLVLAAINLYLGNYINVYILAALAASCLGFLRFNFHPASIFMGDAGSMFLGLVLASVALMGSQHKSSAAAVLLTPLIALAIPVYDTFAAIMRRISLKQSIFKADKKHLHHRLLELGLTQRQIVIFLYISTLYLSAFGFLFILIPKEYAFILLSLVGLGGAMAIAMLGFIEDKLRAALLARRRYRSRKIQ